MPSTNKTILAIFSLLIFSAFVHVSYANVRELNKEEIQNAGVWIPEDEFIAYYDSNRLYTVIGTIKNFEEFSIIPTIIINIQDEGKKISKSFEYVPISSSNEMPFKIKFPEIKGDTPILEKPKIAYIPTEESSLEVEVIYDETLIQHKDGHITGQIVNKGSLPVYDIKVFAIVHGFDEILDMSQNLEMIEKLEPREIRSFSMFPDPSIIFGRCVLL